MASAATLKWLRAAWVAGIIAFLAVSVMPIGRTPLSGVEMGDKIAHFGVFFILAIFPVSTGAVRTITVFFVLLLLAVGSESLQALVPFRSWEVSDIVADLVGILAGLVIGKMLSR
jgi:VanZ family protein